MRYKLKQDAVVKTSELIGKKIINETFESFDKIEGERLIALTNSRQVNSFIIRSLFNQWRNEVEKLESPYFDFNHERVKEALKAFMNVLSNHISINSVHLEPLLFKAIEDALLISFEPRQFLESVLGRIDKPQDFKLQFKYIKTNRDLFKSLVDRIGDFDTKASVLLTYDALDTSNIESVDAEDFLQKLSAEDQLNELFEAIEEPVVIEEPKENPIKETATEETTIEPAPKVENDDSPVTINDKFDTQSKGMTLAEKLQRKVNQSIEASLTLNEKFMFQNNLFGGDNAKMKTAFASIDEASSLDDALNRANAFNTDWDMDSEEVEAFMGVLERRFA